MVLITVFTAGSPGNRWGTSLQHNEMVLLSQISVGDFKKKVYVIPQCYQETYVVWASHAFGVCSFHRSDTNTGFFFIFLRIKKISFHRFLWKNVIIPLYASSAKSSWLRLPFTIMKPCGFPW